jgi:hypothetical protein
VRTRYSRHYFRSDVKVDADWVEANTLSTKE